MSTKIIAIGGGEITLGETMEIDKEIIKLSKKSNPKVLFIPTASSDSQSYCRDFKRYYQDQLKSQVAFLYLVRERQTLEQIKMKIIDADIIYVGGGNTLKMMKLWRKLGVHKLLYQAWQSGTVLCGTSAGAICWFESGHSDSMSFYHPENWQYINVKGLGFLKGTLCPHYNGTTYDLPRKQMFQKMIVKTNKFGIALDERVALVCTGEKYRVLSCNPKFGAYKVFNQNKKTRSIKIEEFSEYRLESLNQKY